MAHIIITKIRSQLEQQITDKYAARHEGQMPSKYHVRPFSTVNNRKQYYDVYRKSVNEPLGGRY